MISKILIFGGLATVLVIALFRAAFIYKPMPMPKSCIETSGHERIKLNSQILDRFKGALNIPTISYGENNYDGKQLLRLANFIEFNFPQIHRASFIGRERIANYTLLYTIDGTDKSLRPYMLTSHLDVVPVIRDKWSSDPFDAVIKEDNFIYARGAIDAKHLLVSMLEAFEFMLIKGFRPRRSFYLVFGHDEEIRGREGALAIANILHQRLQASKWKQLEFVLDEGGIISKTRFPGLDADIGLMGVAEKGYLTVKVSANGSVGHGSMPPPQTAISRLATAMAKFHSHLFPSFMGQGVEREMFDVFAAHSSWPHKLIYANFWLAKPLLNYIFESDPTLNSLIRTSTAVTMIQGGTKENVLPDSATAYINHRLHPLQTSAEVLEFDRKIINDQGISVEAASPATESTPIAPYCDDCYGFQLIKHSILQVYPGTVVVPFTFLAATDSRWYTGLTSAIYKFSAIAVPMDEMKRFHGHDERISLDNYENLINFYHHLITNSDAVKLNFKPKQNEEL